MDSTLAAAVASNALTRRVLAGLRAARWDAAASARTPITEPSYIACDACEAIIRQHAAYGKRNGRGLCFTCWFIEGKDVT